MPIQSFTIKIATAEEVLATIHVDVPTKKDATYCANSLLKTITATLNVNRRLCELPPYTGLTAKVEDYIPGSARN